MAENITIVFIISPGRSGAHYAMSLIDGHPQVSCIPTEMVFHRFWDHHNCDVIRDPLQLSETILRDFRISRFRHGPFVIMPEVQQEQQEWHCIDFDLLEKLFTKFMLEREVSRRNSFLSLHQAFFKTIGGNLDNLRAIVEFGGLADYNGQRLADFPSARILEVTRNPLAVFNSKKMINYRTHDGLLHSKHPVFSSKFLLSRDNQLMVHHFRQMYDLQARVGSDQYFRFVVEDFNVDLDSAITRFARWLGIKDDPCLRQSTILGAKFLLHDAGDHGDAARILEKGIRYRPLWHAHGNSAYPPTVDSAKPDHTSGYRSWSYALERRALEFIYYRHMEHVGYVPEFVTSESNRLQRYIALLAWSVPFWGEIGWISNRHSRAFSERVPSRLWLKRLWQRQRIIAKAIRWCLIPIFLLRAVPVFLLHRIFIFGGIWRGKYDLDPTLIMRKASDDQYSGGRGQKSDTG